MTVILLPPHGTALGTLVRLLMDIADDPKTVRTGGGGAVVADELALLYLQHTVHATAARPVAGGADAPSPPATAYEPEITWHPPPAEPTGDDDAPDPSPDPGPDPGPAPAATPRSKRTAARRRTTA